MRTPLQERLEARPAGRVLISAFLVVTLAAVCATNLPESRLRREALKPAGPFLRATGLDQDWRVFAPDPRSRESAEARGGTTLLAKRRRSRSAGTQIGTFSAGSRSLAHERHR